MPPARVCFSRSRRFDDRLACDIDGNAHRLRRAARFRRSRSAPYEFAYASRRAQPIQLSCKQWEDAWNHPHGLARGNRRRVAVAGGKAELAAGGRHMGPSLAGRGAARLPRTKLGAGDLPAAAAGRRGARSASPCANARARRGHRTLSVVGPGLGAGPDRRARPRRRRSRRICADRHFLCRISAAATDLMVALPGSGPGRFRLKGRIDLLLIEPGTAPCSISPQRDFSGCRAGSSISRPARRQG